MFKKKNSDSTEIIESNNSVKKGKKISKKLIVGGVVLAIAAVMIIPNMFAGEPLPVVDTVSVSKSDIKQTVSTSGMVESDEQKTFFADFTARINELNVEKGANIKAGELLAGFDASSLESQYEQARLTNVASQSGYQASINKSNENATKYNNASNDIEVLEQQVDDWENYVIGIQKSINNESNALGDLETKLASTTNKDKIKKIKTQIKEKQDHLTELNNELLSAQTELNEFQGNLSEQQSIKASSEAGVLNSNEKAQLSANNEVTKLSKEELEKKLELAKAGITSEFNGIVTDVQVTEGATVSDGTPLFTIANNESVSVNVPLTKYDLETVKEGQDAEIIIGANTYNGKVASISRVAQTNQAGTQVVSAKIHIDNPDDNIFLGIEAKVKITVGSENQAVTVPSECVNTDIKGTFCYIINNGVVERKDIETGLMSTELTQIKSGLNEGDKVISTVTGDITEGMQVKENIMPDSASTEGE